MSDVAATPGSDGAHSADEGNLVDDNPLLDAARTRRWFWMVVGSIILLVVGLCLYNLFVDVPLVISPETTYITPPLTADGNRVDYFAAVEAMRYPPEMQTDDNGYRLIVRELGLDSDLSAVQQEQVYKKLGLKVTPPTLTFTEPYAFLRAYAQTTYGEATGPEYYEMVEKLDHPWTIDDLPMMEDWIKDNNPALDLVAKAVRKPLFSLPIIQQGSGDLLLWSADRGPSLDESIAPIGRSLRIRARYFIASGDIDAAINDIVLARQLGARRATTAPLLGETIDSLGNMDHHANVGIAEDPDHPPTLVQLQRLASELDAIRPYPELLRCLSVDRLEQLEFVQWLSDTQDEKTRKLLFQISPSNVPRNTSHSIDWNVVAQTVNERWDELIRGDAPPPPLTVSQYDLLFRRIRSIDLAGTAFSPWLSEGSAVQEAIRRSECHLNLYLISLAMLIYERQHGVLPPAFTVDAEGEPLHSWRVLLLPILGEKDLYDKIKLDEPWDSPHNKQFHNQVVKAYTCPSGHFADGETNCTVIIGDETPFSGGAGKRLDSFGPDSVDMILVAERITPINWMDPSREIPMVVAEWGINMPYTASGAPTTPATTGLGSEHPGGAQFALRSGRVTFLSENIDRAILRGLLTGTTKYAP